MAIGINEIFYSIQGEGILTGAPTIFIRTTGCNLRCSWCDTEYAFYAGEEREVEDIVEEIQILKARTGCMRLCLTGGEPLIQEEVPELIFQLLHNGFQLSLETNGSLSLLPVLHVLRGHPKIRDSLLVSLDIKCPSSGEEKRMDLDNLRLLTIRDQLKFVVNDQRDIEYAYKILHENPVPCPVIVQPVSSGEYSREALKEMASVILKTRLEGRDIRFMLQLHKLIYGKKRGV